MNDPRMICISEIFGPTIQGEGALIGQPTVFVRTGGCDYHCSWCDTLHAVEGAYRKNWQEMTAEEVFKHVVVLSGGHPLMISLSGGNPAIQPLGSLIALGKMEGYTFGLETQGSIAKDWFAELDLLTLSPKPPSSGMRTNWQRLQECIDAAQKTTVVLKLVVLDEADFSYAQQVAERFPNFPVYLQPCNPVPSSEGDVEVDFQSMTLQLRWLVDKVLEAQWYKASVLPQLHVLLWGQKRGV
ncbi:MAG: 7-carboxy-7-deazaguanine synthase QueE [Desulforhopalus sp.]